MKKSFNQLRDSISSDITLNKSKLEILTWMVIGLLSKQTVNLVKLSSAIVSKAKDKSNYKRLQRLISGKQINFDEIARFNYNQILSQKDSLYLVLDRTNWKVGRTDINILMLSAVHEGVAIPLYYELLDHQGNSDSAIRIKLMKRYISEFGKSSIACVSGDREFIGKDWLGWLDREGIKFTIRVKSNQKVLNSKDEKVAVSSLFRDLKTNETVVLRGKRNIMGMNLRIAGSMDKNQGKLIVVTNCDKYNPIGIYGFRWEIESLFQALKGRGFNLEDTHITDKNRIAQLLAILSIAFVWAHKVGEYRDANIKEIPRKKHGRLQYSYFKYGLMYLAEAIAKIYEFPKIFKLAVKLLNKSYQKLNL